MAKRVPLFESLRRLVTLPLKDATRSQRALRYAADLTRHCASQLHRDEAPSMAAALTYRTIFSLVPIAVLMLLVFKAFGGFENLSSDLQRRIYSYLGLSSIVLPVEKPPPPQAQTSPDQNKTAQDAKQSTQSLNKKTLPSPPKADRTEEPPAPPEASPDAPTTTDNDPLDANADPARQEAKEELRSSIDKIIADLTRKASEVKLASLGFVGLALFIWAALSLVITVEQSFNKICRCSQGRSWRLRIPIYWAVITLGPVLLFVSFYVAEQLVLKVQSLDPIGFLAPIFSTLTGSTALLASWLLLFLLYIFMPNTHVRRRSALIGALVAAILWEFSKWGFKLYVSRAVSYSAIYGSLGLVPLFLMWLYITWLIVLFGLELTYTLQTLRNHRIPRSATEATSVQDVVSPQRLIPALVQIAQAFQKGQVLSTEHLASRLDLPLVSAEQITRQLEKSGLIHQAQRNGPDGPGYALALPPGEIKLANVIDLGTRTNGTTIDCADSWDPSATVLQTLREAQKSAVGDLSLAQVIEPGSTNEKTNGS